ncbi:MAG: thiamine pyrophosphate-dependent enzyme [Acidimicrobiia bacterium]|nr:thiamine pyrophosphate-dependent enzyme [Acidimicrobiia bacterium]
MDLEVGEIKDSHLELGLSDEQVIDLYRKMLLTRIVDDRTWALNRQGRAPFVVSSSGHEAAQVASAFALDPTIDWALPYYRDIGVALAWGFTPYDYFMTVFSRAADVTSGGRQMPGHWSDPARNVFSHSSAIATQYPHAAGIAYALQMDKTGGVVAVYGGEGSTSEGDWHEMMNFAGVRRLPLVVIIENNQYAISVPETEEVGGIIADRALGYGFQGALIDGNDALAVYGATRSAAERARAGEGPTLIEARTYRYYAHTSDDDDKLYRSREEVEQWRRRDPLILLKQYLIEARLLPDALEEEIQQELRARVADAVEQAEAEPYSDDATSNVYANPIVPSVAATEPEPEPGGEEVNMIQAINMTLHEIMAAHPEAVVFGEDVADPKGGVFKATQDLTDTFGAARSFNTPLSESLIVGAGIGLSAAGKMALAEVQFADYIHPAFDQIVSEVARVHYRTNGRWNVNMVIRTPYGGGINGGLYHSQSVEAFYTHVPGLKVVVPSTPADVKGLLWEAAEDPDPVLFLEPKKLYRLGRGPYPNDRYRIPLGKAAIRRPGRDVTLIAYGAMAFFTLEAAALLEIDGVDAEVIDLRSLKPLDWPTIEASVRKTNRVLIIHEDNEFMGFGAEVAAQIADRAFESLDAPVKRYASPDVPTFPFATVLEEKIRPNVEGIIKRAKDLVEY